MELDEFRSSLTGLYITLICKDKKTGCRLSSRFETDNDSYPMQVAFRRGFQVTTPTDVFETRSFSRATRKYWEIVYNSGKPEDLRGRKRLRGGKR